MLTTKIKGEAQEYSLLQSYTKRITNQQRCKMKLSYLDGPQPQLQAEEITHFNTHELSGDARENLFMPDRSYFVCVDQDSQKIVAVLCYRQKSGYSEHHAGLGYISVSQNYKNKKIATTLLRKLFEKIKELDLRGLRVGYYEPEGEKYLPAVLAKFSQEFKAELI